MGNTVIRERAGGWIDTPAPDPPSYLRLLVLTALLLSLLPLQNENGLSSGDITDVTLDVSANGSFTVTSLKTVKLGSQKGGCKCIYSVSSPTI